MERRLFQWLRAAMLVCATVWVVSCSNDDNAVIEPADGPGAAYRAVLRGLDWGPDTTFVYGHKTPDVDAVCSALGYARLMRAQAVAEAIFGPSLRPGMTYSKEHLSRKQIVPKIMEILQ